MPDEIQHALNDAPDLLTGVQVTIAPDSWEVWIPPIDIIAAEMDGHVCRAVRIAAGPQAAQRARILAAALGVEVIVGGAP